MDNSQQGSGFNQHVLNQLRQAAQQAPPNTHGRGRGRGYGRGRQSSSMASRGPHPGRPLNTQHQMPFQGPPPSMESFPPLGSQNLPSQLATTPMPGAPSSLPHQQPRSIDPAQSLSNSYTRQADAREFFDRSRGAYRGRQNSYQPRQPYGPAAMAPQLTNDYRRPPVPHGQLYQATNATNGWPSSADQQRTTRHQVMAQSDYLNQIQQAARNKYQLQKDEKLQKEDFRKRLEDLARQALVICYPAVDIEQIRLRCYGSLNNGFGLADCDMDLLLALPDGFEVKLPIAPEGDLTKEAVPLTTDFAGEANKADAASDFTVGWLLEKALHDAGIGARLLTKTRVPILKICERPSEELLENLRQYRQVEQDRLVANDQEIRTDTSLLPPLINMGELQAAVSDLEDENSAAEVSLPDSPRRPGASLEFAGDFGIKCDINFTNFVALHNTN